LTAVTTRSLRSGLGDLAGFWVDGFAWAALLGGIGALLGWLGNWDFTGRESFAISGFDGYRLPCVGNACDKKGSAIGGQFVAGLVVAGRRRHAFNARIQCPVVGLL
jgi:hypothetical protein